MKQFDEWYYYVKSEGKLWPSFGRYDTEAELIAAKEAWIAALEWALKWGLSRGKVEEELKSAKT